METGTSSKRTLNPTEIAAMQELWETTTGDKKAKARDIAEQFGVHPNTVRQRATRDGWYDPEEGDLEAIAEVREAATQVAPDWMDQDVARRMQTRILELERELASERANVEKLRPDVDVDQWLFANVDDVIAFYGEEKLTEIAMGEVALENKRRVRAGHPPLDSQQMNALMSPSRIAEEARKILAERRNSVPSAPAELMRMVKMIAPTKECGCNFDTDGNPTNCYTHGSLRSIPFEPQVNNMRGSLYDATQRYVNKGFKITAPYLCMGGPCCEPAAVDARGKFIHGGYCSEDHRSRTKAEAQGNAPRQMLSAMGAGR